MPELPNLLRQRLAATENGDAQAHPDADTLTAYVEQSLPTAERQTVVAHLAVCEPCREVVALSQPELLEVAAQTVLKPAPVSGWRRLFTPGLWPGGFRGSHGGDRGFGASASTEVDSTVRSEYPASQGNSSARSKHASPGEQIGAGAACGNRAGICRC